VDATTLDDALGRHLDAPPDFVNITINGAEPEAIEGAIKTLTYPGVTIAFPMRDPKLGMYDLLRKQGASMAVADAPTKAWEGRQFLYVCATKEPPTALEERGFRPARIAPSDAAPQTYDVELLTSKAGRPGGA
jgi:hypothetical protein